MSATQFPVLRSCWLPGRVRSFPWGMIEPHEAQARRNHGQTLARLAERGGLSYGEAVAIMDDLDLRDAPKGDAAAVELERRAEAWLAVPEHHDLDGKYEDRE